jgi:outer membrane protein OmpA-like peptidoglycan-associated protein
MKRYVPLALLALAVPVAVTSAGAQSRVSPNEIVKSLQGVQEKATLNPDDLRAQAVLNIQRNPGENAPSGVPVFQNLAKFRQFNVEINFDFDSDRIRPESYETVGAIADALHTPYLWGQKFFIVGHTDAKGKREYNLELSERRAQAVLEALITTFRVPASQVEAVGLGEEQLRDPSKPNAGVNRRVQLINIGF